MWRFQDGLQYPRTLNARMLRLSLVLPIVLVTYSAVSAHPARSDGPHVIEESWTAQQGAPEDTNSLAQTTDGFLWLGGRTGLFRFDGTRFERFHALSGDQLLSTNVYAISAAPSGGLWVGYTFGGFSFVNNGQVKNYATMTGSIYQFAQEANGIVWAAATSGLWRFEHSTWQHLGTEWSAPDGSVGSVAFDRTGTLWVIAQKTLLCLRPGEKQFHVADENLNNHGFTVDADAKVITRQLAHHNSSGNSNDGLDAYPILRDHSASIVDRTNSVWIVSTTSKLSRRFC